MITTSRPRTAAPWRRLLAAFLLVWLLLARPTAAQPDPSVLDLPDDPNTLGGAPVLSVARVDDILQATQKRLDQAREAFRPVPLADVEHLVADAAKILSDLRLGPEVPNQADLL